MYSKLDIWALSATLLLYINDQTLIFIVVECALFNILKHLTNKCDIFELIFMFQFSISR